jgi:hypothetical protein
MVDPQEYVDLLLTPDKKFFEDQSLIFYKLSKRKLHKEKDSSNEDNSSEEEEELEEYFANTKKRQGYQGFSDEFVISNPYLRRAAKRVKAERKLIFYRFLQREIHKVQLLDKK